MKTYGPLIIATTVLLVPGLAFGQATAPSAPEPAPTAPPASATAPYAPAPVAPPPAYMAPAPEPAASPAPSHSLVEFTSLRLMRDKGIISQGEYDSAIHDIGESAGQRAPDQGTLVIGKWATTMYGFVEADQIYDTTRSLNDLAGGSQILRADTEGGENGRYQSSIRNSRIGFRLKAPELPGEVRTSAQLEMDFLGTQAIGTGTGQVSEGSFFTSPLLRVRHFNFKVETPVVDILVGQYWQLFGWQSAYQPNTVELQGMPGELYSRTPQVRISKTIKAYPITFEIAAAASRPVQRDSATPDGQGGIRFAVDAWTGVQTVGATGTTIAPLSIAATGLLRHVAVDQFAASPKSTKDLGLSAFAVDGFLPVIPGTKSQKDNSLSFNGEFATGYGFADMYTGLTGGAGFPSLPNTSTGAAQTYTPDIDPGIVTFDSGGGIHGIQWTTYLLGAQYYLPGVDGKVWVSGNYSHSTSANAGRYGTAAKIREAEDWFDANLFVDPTPSLRVGFEYANFNDMYRDGQHAINHRAQLSGFFIF